MIKKADNVDLNSSGKVPGNNVYFVPETAGREAESGVLSLENVLKHRMFHLLSRFREKDVVALKLCENHPAETSKYICSIARLLNEKGITGFIAGTSRRHENRNDNGIVAAHSALCICNDLPEPFTYMPLDGIYGEHEITRKNDRRLGEDVFLAGELPNLDGLISISCILASSDNERAGSIVNLGHGLASKKGKIYQMTVSCPQVNVRKCYTCRRCVRICPTHAITIGKGHVVIDPGKCIKCGRCVEIARYGGIKYNWDADAGHYDTLVARHAKGVLDVLDNRVICINIVLEPKGKHFRFAGAMVSCDPVAADSATVDFCVNNGFISERIAKALKARVSCAEKNNAGSEKHHLSTVAY